MERSLEQAVWNRAASRCEYCQIHQDADVLSFEIDHIIARKHRGLTESENLALACFSCNNHKGPNVAGVDPESGAICRLFHPRRDRWNEHFEWHGPLLVGLTAIGRTTVEVLVINIAHRVALRRQLLEEKSLEES